MDECLNKIEDDYKKSNASHVDNTKNAGAISKVSELSYMNIIWTGYIFDCDIIDGQYLKQPP